MSSNQQSILVKILVAIIKGNIHHESQESFSVEVQCDRPHGGTLQALRRQGIIQSFRGSGDRMVFDVRPGAVKDAYLGEG